MQQIQSDKNLLLFQRQFSRRSVLADRQKMVDNQPPFHRLKRLMPTSRQLCYNPANKHINVGPVGYTVVLFYNVGRLLCIGLRAVEVTTRSSATAEKQRVSCACLPRLAN